jgi:RNA methyltransferase, TrmH family
MTFHPPNKPRGGKPVQKAARPRHRAKTEEMFHGLRACEAIFAKRPAEMIRVYVSLGRQKQLAKLLAWCAKEKKGYQIVADESLERLTKSIHHEGVAILATQIARWDLAALLAHVAEAKPRSAAEPGSKAGIPPLLYLDGVQTPHNLGSILRTAAHFGAGAVIGKAGDLPPLSPAAVRVAEGAAEHVPVCDLADPARDLARLKKAGYQVVVTSSRRGESLFAKPLGPRVVLVLGSEGEGVSRPIDALADRRVMIPGTAAVESLNVSVACGIVLAEAWRAKK